ncbi:hypothetical protein NFI96_029725 [Prochilodus magdalenae]|nr:hypothetical protein NFI96_029725 [Prochilodus magdalenae]
MERGRERNRQTERERMRHRQDGDEKRGRTQTDGERKGETQTDGEREERHRQTERERTDTEREAERHRIERQTQTDRERERREHRQKERKKRDTEYRTERHTETEQRERRRHRQTEERTDREERGERHRQRDTVTESRERHTDRERGVDTDRQTERDRGDRVQTERATVIPPMGSSEGGGLVMKAIIEAAESAPGGLVDSGEPVVAMKPAEEDPGEYPEQRTEPTGLLAYLDSEDSVPEKDVDRMHIRDNLKIASDQFGRTKVPEWQRIAGKAAKEVEKFAKEKADLVLMHWRDKMGIAQKELGGPEVIAPHLFRQSSLDKLRRAFQTSQTSEQPVSPFFKMVFYRTEVLQWHTEGWAPLVELLVYALTPQTSSHQSAAMGSSEQLPSTLTITVTDDHKAEGATGSRFLSSL